MAKHVGRHRAPGYSPLHELTQIAAASGAPAARASAVVLMSGGLVAALGTSASAVEAPTTGSSAPTVTAPAAAAAPDAFGSIGFVTKKVVKTVVAAAPAPDRASRTTTRAAAPAAAPAAPDAAPAIANNGSIIGIAASLTGIPYRYGGSSTSGVDCSGFTSLVYRMAGIEIPRTAEAQRAASTRVSDPQPGDLVFVGIPATHAGIYAGPGMMYDAQHTGTVTGLHKIWTSNVTYGRF